MKYGEETASNCREVTGIDELTESEVKFEFFVAKYSNPFFVLVKAVIKFFEILQS